MRRSLVLFAATIFFGAMSLAARAETLDLDKVKCKDFVASSKEDIGYTLAWLDGFYKEDEAPPIIDFEKLKANAAKLGTYCTAHPDQTVGDAAEDLFGSN